MKKYVIDTNALISFVTDRNLTQQEAVAPLFEAASRSKCTIVCHQFVLAEFVFVMDKVYGTPKETIRAILRDFISMPGVELRQETDFNTGLALWPEKIADFGDALVASASVSVKGAVTVTFDTKLRSALTALGLSVYHT